MIEKITLKDYRGFENHTLRLKPTTIVVGQNNAGKSTIVEALRLASLINNRLISNKTFVKPPMWVGLHKLTQGISISLKNIDIDLKTVSNNYKASNPEVEVHFSNGNKIKIFVSGDQGQDKPLYAVAYNAKGKQIRNKRDVTDSCFPHVEILPQITTLSLEERRLNEAYVKDNLSSRRSSLHFRNQLYYFDEFFEDFQKAVQKTWTDINVRALEGGRIDTKDDLFQLLVRDYNFVGEVGFMGHGLQMWLQIMWFLVRAKAKNATTVILDEPDVYMHADLQRKLIRYIRDKFDQIIIATHSVEIISEVEPEEILVIDRHKTESRFALSEPAVQAILTSVGSIHNLQLTRLLNVKRFLFIEGNDIDYLRRFHNTLFPQSDTPLDTIPHSKTFGWGGWKEVIGVAKFLRENTHGFIKVYCIFDSDYHTPQEKEKRYKEAQENNIQLHIWQRKEIENYLLIPSAIQRAISKVSEPVPTIGEVTKTLEDITAKLEHNVTDDIATELQKSNKHWETKKANEEARKRVRPFFGNLEGRLHLV